MDWKRSVPRVSPNRWMHLKEEKNRIEGHRGIAGLPAGMIPPPKALPKQRMSGSTFQCSTQNILPVLPIPVWTSSAMNRAPYLSHRRRTPGKYSSFGTMIPPSPKIGSNSTAAKRMKFLMVLSKTPISYRHHLQWIADTIRSVRVHSNRWMEYGACCVTMARMVCERPLYERQTDASSRISFRLTSRSRSMHRDFCHENHRRQRW